MWKKFFIVLAIVTIVPIFSLCLSLFIINHYESEWQNGIVSAAKTNSEIDPKSMFGFFELCGNSEIRSQFGQFDKICNHADEVQKLYDYSIYALLFSIILELFVILIGLIGRINRFFLAHIFKPSLYIMLLSLCILVATQGALVFVGAVFFESAVIGRVHSFLIGGIGLAACYGVFQLLISVLKIPINASMNVFGISLDRNTHSKLYQYVENMAR